MTPLFNKIKDLLRILYVSYSMPRVISSDGREKVLISYLKSPFYLQNRPIKHANVIESRSIFKVFRELGYSVDIVDWRCKRNIEFSKYDVIFGFGTPFIESFNKDYEIQRICYMPGCSPNFSNTNEATRINLIHKQKGVLLRPRREVYWPWMHAVINSDLVIVGGNDHTVSTYTDFTSNVESIPIPAVPLRKEICHQESVNKGLIWFGGAGAVHKGLDLVLEAVVGLDNDVKLDICGPIEGELDFFDLYKDYFNHQDITFNGMIDPNSDRMKEIIKKNSFVILPSCSEGMPSSVSTCMQFGLIPIVTKECGIDIKSSFGIEIDSLDVAGVKNAIKKALSLDNHSIKGMKKKSIEHSRIVNSKNNYETRLLEILKIFGLN